jgi:hypothetical protein
MTFNASGTGSHNAAYLELALFEDGNGNGLWEGSGLDGSASANTAVFAGNSATFTLSNSVFTANQTRRFFLAAKMNGTASTGQTFNANLQDANASPMSAGGVKSGMPTAASTALVINSAAVTILNGPAQPSAVIHDGGSSADYLVGDFRVHALNGPCTVNGITLTGGGTGDWLNDVSGIIISLDDGNGVFDVADGVIFSGAGAAGIVCNFTVPVALATGNTRELWIEITLSATAGMGQLATPETFTLSIASAADINASVQGILGTPSPASVSLGAIEFDVSSFDPGGDKPGGGAAVTIQGSGFLQPFSVTIGGVLCPGTAVINGGTSVSGLLVPPGSGKSLPIVINSGSLPPQTLSQTFNYGSSTGTGSSGSSGGCTGGAASSLLIPGLLALAALRKRRKA